MYSPVVVTCPTFIPLAFGLVLFVILSASLKATGLNTDGSASTCRLRSLLSVFRRVTSFAAMCALLFVTGCLTFVLASLAIMDTLQLLSSPSFPRLIRLTAQAALLPCYSSSDFFSVAGALIGWITLEIPTKVYYGYYHSSTPSDVELARVKANKLAQVNSHLLKELRRMRRCAKVYERKALERGSVARSKHIALSALKARHRRVLEFLNSSARCFKQQIAQRRGAESNLRLLLHRQLELYASQAARHDQDVSILHERIGSLHVQNGELQSTIEDLHATNDQLRLEVELYEDLRDAQVADHHMQVGDLHDQIDSLQFANADLQGKLDDIQEMHERELTGDHIRDWNAHLIRELEEQMEDQAVVEREHVEEISRVLAQNAATQNKLQRASTRSVILSLRIEDLEGNVAAYEDNLIEAHDEISALKDQLTTRDIEYDTLRHTHQELVATNENHIEEISRLTTRHDRLSQQLIVDSEAHAHTRAALFELRQELTDTHAKLERAESDGQTFRGDLTEAKKEIAEIRDQATREHDKREALQTAYSESGRMVHALEAELVVMMQSNAEDREALAKQLAEVQERHKRDTEAASKRFAKLSETHRSLQGRCKSLKADFDKALERCAEMESQCTDEIEQRWFMEKALREEEAFRLDVSMACDRQVQAAKDEAREAKNLHKALADKLRSFQAKNEMLRAECDRREKHEDEQEQALRSARVQINELRSAQPKVAAPRDRSQQPDTRVLELQRTITYLESQLDMLAQESMILKEMLRSQADAEVEARGKAEKELEDLKTSLRSSASSCPPTPSLVSSSPASLMDSPGPLTPALVADTAMESLGCPAPLSSSATVTRMSTAGLGLGLTF